MTCRYWKSKNCNPCPMNEHRCNECQDVGDCSTCAREDTCCEGEP